MFNANYQNRYKAKRKQSSTKRTPSEIKQSCSTAGQCNNEKCLLFECMQCILKIWILALRYVIYATDMNKRHPGHTYYVCVCIAGTYFVFFTDNSYISFSTCVVSIGPVKQQYGLQKCGKELLRRKICADFFWFKFSTTDLVYFKCP